MPLAKPLGIFSVAQYELCQLSYERSQSASINYASKSSSRKALIMLHVGALGGDFTVSERRYRPC